MQIDWTKVVLTTAAAWLVPGGGHFLQQKWVRGALVCAVILSLLAIGLSTGGIYFFSGDNERGIIGWLYYISTSGSAVVGLAVNTLKGAGSLDAVYQAARSSTFEYGGKMIVLAGLLNFLAVFDAVDVLLQRKQ